MGQLIVGITLLCLALLVGVGFWLEVGSDALAPDAPLDIGPDPSLPNDGQDGNVVVTLGKGKQTFERPRAPGDPEKWERGAPLTRDEKAAVKKGYLPYVVQSGETLSAIAERYLGKAHLWKQILEHNRVDLMRPEDLRAGMSIRIPLWLKQDF